MDLTRLRHIVEIYRPWRLISSLPFLVNDGQRKVRWFVYSMDQLSDCYQLTIERIYTLDQTGRVDIKLINDFNLSIPMQIERDIDSNFDESNYYDKFAYFFNNGNDLELESLLENSESKQSKMIYDSVNQYYENYIKCEVS